MVFLHLHLRIMAFLLLWKATRFMPLQSLCQIIARSILIGMLKRALRSGLSIDRNGLAYKEVAGTPKEQAELEQSYKHLCTLRDEVIEMGVLPPIDKWHDLNNNID